MPLLADSSGIAYLFLLPILIFVLYVAFLFIVGNFDTKRITEDLAGRGCRLLSMKAAGFWEGGLGDKANRIYKISYVDAAGHRHTAICKTSMLGGVYFKSDSIEGVSSSALKLENARLRAQLDQVEQRQKQTARWP